MERVKFIEHCGVQILLSDLSGIRSTQELQRATRLASEFVQSHPPHSLRILVDVTGVEYNIESFAIVQQSVAVNRPFVRARAVVGLPAIAAVPFSLVAALSGSPMASFEDHDSARDWLIAQP